MYVPKQFEAADTSVLHQLMDRYPFGVMVTLDQDGLNANHIPFVIDPEPKPFGTLRAHVARSNPVWQGVENSTEVLVIFQGTQSYISPGYYPTKHETGKVVPTYNYEVVHAYGAMRVIEDPNWLMALVTALTNRHESGVKSTWKVTDAPSDYVDKMLTAVVGIEIPISRLVGKSKVSQNQPKKNQEGVVAGLRNLNTDSAKEMAQVVQNAIDQQEGR